jgi:hypothetical protein
MLDLVKLLHYKRVGMLHLAQITILPETESDRNTLEAFLKNKCCS